ncbi:hypothetical protein A3765_28485 [Oleiphilus sp. HI0130]|nr:hypothetical protein A3765_28800 [Oleiphilus sp. HI0130]KZZ72490.1 hypothetical protein A3765_28485 [Oleiphilus sp. HI0130]
MTNVPKAALKQLEQAEELHKQMYGEKPETAPEAQAQPEPTQPATPPQNEPPKDPAPEPESAGHAIDQPEFTEENFRKLQHALKTLQGKYSAEVPRLQQQNRELQEQLASASRQKADAQQEADSANDELSRMRDRLTKELGEDATNAVDEYAKTVVKSEMNEFRNEQAKSTTDTFWFDVLESHPDFNAVNQSAEFVTWLQNTNDEITGMPLQFALNQAGESLNSKVVVKIVQQFKNAKAARNAQPKAEDHVAPQQTPPANQPSQPSYTITDWTELQKQRQRGEWNGKEAEANALEQEMHAALFAH